MADGLEARYECKIIANAELMSVAIAVLDFMRCGPQNAR
jgi:hypothetical protein